MSEYKPPGQAIIPGSASSQYILNTFRACVTLGCDEAALLETIPGGKKALHNPSLRFQADVMVNMLHAAERLTGIQGVGVLAGNQPGLSALAELGYAMVASDTLESMIKLYRKYQPLLQNIGMTDVLKKGDTAFVVLDTQPGTDPNYVRPYIERFFGAVATFGRWVTWDQGLAFKSVAFMHDAPADQSAYEATFKCKLSFNAERNSIAVSRTLIEHPMPQPNPGLVDSISIRLDKQLLELGSPVTSAREALSLIKVRLQEGVPSIVQIADAMGTTERTLRRRLKEEKTTYSQVLEAARRDVCELMISRGLKSPSALSEALGYSETSAFTRAFKTWYGMTPSEYLRKRA